MLSYKERMFLENTAKRLYEEIGIQKQPNIYNYSNLINYIGDMKYKVVFEASENKVDKNTIYLKCKEPDASYTDKEYVEFQKELLYQIWIIAKKKYALIMKKFDEADARVFFRAMLMPEKAFVEEVTKNINTEGMCNIFKVAKVFNVDYMDVSARGNDLGIWNRKGEC